LGQGAILGMKYEEARLSGKPFNRKKYKDGWYLYDHYRKVDFAKDDHSLRLWREEDLKADDWHILDDKKKPRLH
jgi:hypothetical protein